MRKLYALLVFALPLTAQSQLAVDTVQNPAATIESIFLSNGIFTSNITVSGANQQFGTFDGSSSSIGLNEGIILSSGDVRSAELNGFYNMAQGTVGGDPDLEALTGYLTYDLSAIEFDFLATGDSMNFRFVFASQEYPEYVNSSFNDVFGFFVSGPGISGTFTNQAINIATVPGTGDYVSINTINEFTNNAYYVPGDWTDNACDAYTVVMNASVGGLQVGESYHIKIAITDASDSVLDSWVFLGGDSFEQFCTVDLLGNQDRGSAQCMLSNIHGSALYTEECGTIQLFNYSEMNVAFTNAYYTMGDDNVLPVDGTIQEYTYTAEGEYPIWLVYEVGEFRSQSYVGTMQIAFNAPLTPELSVDDNVVSVSNYGGVDPLPSFQWYLNGEPIEGATGLELEITESGIYSVTANNGCPAQSEEISLEYVGVGEFEIVELGIFPNPSNGPVTVRWSGHAAQLNIYNTIGARVGSYSVGTTPVTIENLAAGSYIATVTDESGNILATRQLIVIR